ncbi:MAG: PocR ligand-binding domain-containing protein [Candidatus Omnitrophica bacterium]|nr:PocR ligand-binding domain-containing protein [Candidatus Omnitrophota bacterium]
MEGILLKEVIDIKQWQEIQDHFAQVLGVTIRFVEPNGNLLTRPSKTTRLCEEVIRSSAAGIAQCGRCLAPAAPNLETEQMWKEGYLCPIGLHNFSIPVNLPNNETIAKLLVGPVLLGERQKPGRYREKIAELGIDLDKFIDALIEIKVFSFSGIQSVLELLQDVVCYLVELGYHRFKLEKIIPLPKVSKMVYKFYTDKLLSALLDVSFNVTGAEFGSIMLLDEKSGSLYIKIGRGIKKDIIKHTRLKIGEGVAGLAAQENKFLLLDDKFADERIKNRLQRPEIKSAIVAPIQVEDELFGVMNIGTLHPSDKFSAENIDVLRQLIKLVTTTMTSAFS